VEKTLQGGGKETQFNTQGGETTSFCTLASKGRHFEKPDPQGGGSEIFWRGGGGGKKNKSAPSKGEGLSVIVKKKKEKCS